MASRKCIGPSSSMTRSRGRPSNSSINRYAFPSSVTPKSWRMTVLGLFSFEIISASWTKRSISNLAPCTRRILIATRRPSTRVWAAS